MVFESYHLPDTHIETDSAYIIRYISTKLLRGWSLIIHLSIYHSWDTRTA